MSALTPAPFTPGLRWATPPPRIGCSHPARLDMTTFEDVAQRVMCNACGAQWSALPRMGS